MATTQRVPLTRAEHTQRAPGKAVMQLLRSIDLECRTREEAEDVADAVAGLLPDPVQGRLGLIELLLNAIEHGNLEIGSALKCRLLRDQRFEEEVLARLERAPFCGRWVQVRVDIAYPVVTIEIRDHGQGFGWRSALDAEVIADDSPNGRGLALVYRTCFPTLTFRNSGTVAVVTVTWPA